MTKACCGRVLNTRKFSERKIRARCPGTSDFIDFIDFLDGFLIFFIETPDFKNFQKNQRLLKIGQKGKNYSL